MMRKTIAVALLVGISMPAVAQDVNNIPVYTADQVCADAKGSTMALRICVNAEQWDLDYLRFIWPTLTEPTRRRCITHAVGVGGRRFYGQLKTCVDVYDRADEQNRVLHHGATELR